MLKTKNLTITATFGSVEIREEQNETGLYDIKILMQDDVVFSEKNMNYVKIDDLLKFADNIVYQKCYGKE